jgi:hypothetical protein
MTSEPIPYVYFSSGIKWSHGTKDVGLYGGSEQREESLQAATRTWTSRDRVFLVDSYPNIANEVRPYPEHFHGTVALLEDGERKGVPKSALFASMLFHQLLYCPILKGDYEIQHVYKESL